MRENMQTYFDSLKRNKIIPHNEIIEMYKNLDKKENDYKNVIKEIQYRTDIDDVTKKALIVKAEKQFKYIQKITYDKIVSCNLRLVVKTAKKYNTVLEGISANISLNDLIQEGSIGLIEGVKHFDYTKGFRLGTYVNFWIKRAIIRHLSGAEDRGSIRLVRLPAYVVKLQQMINEIRKNETLRRNAGEDFISMTNEEIATSLDVDVALVNATIAAAGYQCAIVDDSSESSSYTKTAGSIMISTLDGIVSNDTAADGLFDIERIIFKNEIMDSMNEIFSTLTAREEAVLRLRFGIGADDDDINEAYIPTQIELNEIIGGVKK